MIIFNDSIAKSETYLYFLKCEGENPFYIGKTNNPKFRLSAHKSVSQKHNNKSKKAIISRIKSENKTLQMVVFWGGNKSEWKAAERFWISKFKNDWEIPICNIHSGGDGVEFTDEIRAKMSKIKIGKPLPESTKNKMKGRLPWNKGLKINNVKNVEQLSKDGLLINTFNSIKEAGESLNLNRGNISLVVNGKRKTLGGYVFRYSSN